MTSIETHRLASVARSKMLAHCKLLMFSVCASQAAASKVQPLGQQLGFQAKIYERKKKIIEDPKYYTMFVSEKNVRVSIVSDCTTCVGEGEREKSKSLRDT